MIYYDFGHFQVSWCFLWDSVSKMFCFCIQVEPSKKATMLQAYFKKSLLQ